MAESFLPGVESSAVAPSAHLTPHAYGQQGERIIALERGPLRARGIGVSPLAATPIVPPNFDDDDPMQAPAATAARPVVPGVESSAVAPSAHLTPHAYGQQGERIIALERGPLRARGIGVSPLAATPIVPPNFDDDDPMQAPAATAARPVVHAAMVATVGRAATAAGVAPPPPAPTSATRCSGAPQRPVVRAQPTGLPEISQLRKQVDEATARAEVSQTESIRRQAKVLDLEMQLEVSALYSTPRAPAARRAHLQHAARACPPSRL